MDNKTCQQRGKGKELQELRELRNYFFLRTIQEDFFFFFHEVFDPERDKGNKYHNHRSGKECSCRY